MDFIKECFDEHGVAFMASLEAAGLSVEQARKFLPEAASSILDSTQKIGVFQTITCLLSDHHSQLLRMIDVNAIAEKSGMNFDQVASGFHAIALVLLQTYSKKNEKFVGAPTFFAGAQLGILSVQLKNLQLLTFM